MNHIKKWDEKYKQKENTLKEADSFLIDNVNLLKKGSVLDFASGDGRNSIYLAKKGFDVLSADFSMEALKRLEGFANKEDISLKTSLLDLSKKNNLLFLGKFDNIIISHYKVDDSLLPIIENMLNENGVLIYYTFNMDHHIEFGFSKSYCLETKELISKVSLKLLKYETIKTPNSNLDAYIFSK